MKRKLAWGVAVLIPVALFLWAREAASWRPRVLFHGPINQFLVLCPDERSVLSGNHFWDANKQQLQHAPWMTQSEFYGFATPTSYWAAQDLAHPTDGANGNTLTRTKVLRREWKTGRVLWRALDPQIRENNETADITFSTDKKRVLSVAPRGLSEWDTQKGQFLRCRPFLDADELEVLQLGLAPNGKFLYEAYWNNYVHLRVRDTTSLKVAWDVGWNAWLNPEQMGCSPDGKVLWAIGDNKARVVFLDMSSGRRLWSQAFACSVDPISSLIAFSPDGKWVAIPNWTGTQIFAPSTGKALVSRRGPGRSRNGAFALSSDGATLFALGLDGNVALWRMK